MYVCENIFPEKTLAKTDMSLFDISGKVALITGGGSGLGQKIVCVKHLAITKERFLLLI